MYTNKHIEPMLIGSQQGAFDDENFIYELKLDGIRCIAYLDEKQVQLRNKRDLNLIDKFPELQTIYKQVKKPCILDGELFVYKDQQIDFFAIQKRALSSSHIKQRIYAKQIPATFTAFDILYVEDENVCDQPLYKRKQYLHKLVKENERINCSRYIEKEGCELFQLCVERNLEGIVAKRKDSRYTMGKRTKQWIKCKNLLDEDYVVCGYILKKESMVSLVLAQYRDGELVSKGHVTLGVHLSYIQTHTTPSNISPFSQIRKEDAQAKWITPLLCASVSFMEYTQQGGMRQPVLKGFREDKRVEDCIDLWYEQQRM